MEVVIRGAGGKAGHGGQEHAEPQDICGGARSPHRKAIRRMAHLALVKELLQVAADRYREKYELSTQRIDDIKIGINYLSAVRRLFSCSGNQSRRTW